MKRLFLELKAAQTWLRRHVGRQRKVWPHLGPCDSSHSYGIGNLQIRQWGQGTKLHIGRFCSIADSVSVFLGGNHRSDWGTTYPFGSRSTEDFPCAVASQVSGHGDVFIGNDVWVGSGATILSGVTIGDGAVIGARAVVGCDVPPYAVVVGNPARVLRLRFDEAQIARLVSLRWWHLSNEEILSLIPLLCSDRIDDLIAALVRLRAAEETDCRRQERQRQPA